VKVVSAQQQQEVKVRKGKNGAKNLLNLHNEKKVSQTWQHISEKKKHISF
jgi:hypothetical protein